MQQSERTLSIISKTEFGISIVFFVKDVAIPQIMLTTTIWQPASHVATCGKEHVLVSI